MYLDSAAGGRVRSLENNHHLKLSVLYVGVNSLPLLAGEPLPSAQPRATAAVTSRSVTTTGQDRR